MPDEYLIVHKAILPDYYDRVIQAREDLNDKKYLSVQDACKANNISRSTFSSFRNWFSPASTVLSKVI